MLLPQTEHAKKYVAFFKSKRHIDLITKKPCGRCNNGWMAQVEATARPILIPLIHGEKATLSPEQQAIIAIWFFKTSVMFDLHRIKLRPCYFDPNELHKLAGSLACDGRYNFYLAEYRGTKHGFFQEDHLGVAFANADDESYQPIGPPVRAYSFTLLIKRLVLQIFCLKRPLGRRLTYYAPDFAPAYTQLSLSEYVFIVFFHRFPFYRGLGVRKQRLQVTSFQLWAARSISQMMAPQKTIEYLREPSDFGVTIT